MIIATLAAPFKGDASYLPCVGLLHYVLSDAEGEIYGKFNGSLYEFLYSKKSSGKLWKDSLVVFHTTMDLINYIQNKNMIVRGEIQEPAPEGTYAVLVTSVNSAASNSTTKPV